MLGPGCLSDDGLPSGNGAASGVALKTRGSNRSPLIIISLPVLLHALRSATSRLRNNSDTLVQGPAIMAPTTRIQLAILAALAMSASVVAAPAVRVPVRLQAPEAPQGHGLPVCLAWCNSR